MSIDEGSRDDGAVVVFGSNETVGQKLVRRAAASGRRVFALAWPEGNGEPTLPRSGATPVQLGREVERDIEAFFDSLWSQELVVGAAVTVSSRCPASSGTFIETTSAQWSVALERRLRRIFLATRHTLGSFLGHSGGGRIVHVVAGVDPDDTGDAVAIPAVQAFTRSVAREYGRRGIMCNAVLSKGGDEAAVEAALYLLSTEASFVTGEMMEVASDAQ